MNFYFFEAILGFDIAFYKLLNVLYSLKDFTILSNIRFIKIRFVDLYSYAYILKITFFKTPGCIFPFVQNPALKNPTPILLFSCKLHSAASRPNQFLGAVRLLENTPKHTLFLAALSSPSPHALASTWFLSGVRRIVDNPCKALSPRIVAGATRPSAGIRGLKRASLAFCSSHREC